jgi:hypothetical protein
MILSAEWFARNKPIAAPDLMLSTDIIAVKSEDFLAPSVEQVRRKPLASSWSFTGPSRAWCMQVLMVVEPEIQEQGDGHVQSVMQLVGQEPKDRVVGAF